ncbi:YkgB family protein [Nocardia altamirensis]|uniref:YkgB family protein n=1 Tax=Nocardia altamirensis TaxID=472158 RepID=UPI00083FEDF4|nr:DUF417 family protein [Nocardia altamirensis]
MTTKILAPVENRAKELQGIGGGIVRYGLALVLIWIGAMKFFAFEAQGIQPLVENSPLMSWLYNILSVTALSAVLGVIEVALGLLIAAWKWVPGLSALASLGAVVMFLITLSFMLTTPGVWQPGYGFPYLGSAGGFLIKDVVLLGASLATAGASLVSLRRA